MDHRLAAWPQLDAWLAALDYSATASLASKYELLLRGSMMLCMQTYIALLSPSSRMHVDHTNGQ